MGEGRDLQGMRVLVVEDEVLVSMLIEDMCADLGCTFVGPAATLEDAMERSRRDDFDVALVDMNLGGVKADPVIAQLQDRSMPFAIASGASNTAGDGRAAAILNKPFNFAQFSDCLIKLAEQLPAEGLE